MKSLRASTRYAKALLDLSRERQMMDIVKADSDLLLAAIGESRDFRNFLKSAILKPEQKEKTFASVFSNQLSEITMLFVNLLSSMAEKLTWKKYLKNTLSNISRKIR